MFSWFKLRDTCDRSDAHNGDKDDKQRNVFGNFYAIVTYWKKSSTLFGELCVRTRYRGQGASNYIPQHLWDVCHTNIDLLRLGHG